MLSVALRCDGYLAHESRGRVVRVEEGLAPRHHHLGTTPEREGGDRGLEGGRGGVRGSRRRKGLRLFV